MGGSLFLPRRVYPRPFTLYLSHSFFLPFIPDFCLDPLDHFPRRRSFHGNFIFPRGRRYSVARGHKREIVDVSYENMAGARIVVRASCPTILPLFFRGTRSSTNIRACSGSVREKFDSALVVRYRANLCVVVRVFEQGLRGTAGQTQYETRGYDLY